MPEEEDGLIKFSALSRHTDCCAREVWHWSVWSLRFLTMSINGHAHTDLYRERISRDTEGGETTPLLGNVSIKLAVGWFMSILRLWGPSVVWSRSSTRTSPLDVFSPSQKCVPKFLLMSWNFLWQTSHEMNFTFQLLCFFCFCQHLQWKSTLTQMVYCRISNVHIRIFF